MSSEVGLDSAQPGVEVKEPLIDEAGRPTRFGWRKIGELLRKPMQTRQRKGPGGRMLSYITARDVQNRLDGVVGPGNWSTSFHVLSQEPWSSSARSRCAVLVVQMLATPTLLIPKTRWNRQRPPIPTRSREPLSDSASDAGCTKVDDSI